MKVMKPFVLPVALTNCGHEGVIPDQRAFTQKQPEQDENGR